MRKLCLGQVRGILRMGDTVRVQVAGKGMTREFKIPKCGLHLKKGDWVIRHDIIGHYMDCRTAAIDRVLIKDGVLRLRQVLGSFDDAPSIKRKFIDVAVYCV